MATGSITKYRALVRTIECGSISAAAASMDYTQSAFSHMISSLEAKLGYKLIVRHRSGIRLTPEGELIYGRIKEILALQEEIKAISARIRGAVPGLVRIGGPCGLMAALAGRMEAAIHESSPELTVELSAGDAEDLLNRLKVGSLDIGIVCGDPGSSEYTFHPLAEDGIRAVLPASHPLAAAQGPLKPEDLEGIPRLGFSQAESKIAATLTGTEEPQTGRFYCGDVGTLAGMVRDGKGILLAGALDLMAFPTDGLCIRSVEAPAKRQLGAVYRRLTMPDKTVYQVLPEIVKLFERVGETEDPE